VSDPGSHDDAPIVVGFFADSKCCFAYPALASVRMGSGPLQPRFRSSGPIPAEPGRNLPEASRAATHRPSHDRALKHLLCRLAVADGTLHPRGSTDARCRHLRRRPCEHLCSIESPLFFCCFSRQDTHSAFANQIPPGESIRFLPPCAQFTLTCRASTRSYRACVVCRIFVCYSLRNSNG
jgi:hypothetical protein